MSDNIKKLYKNVGNESSPNKNEFPNISMYQK